MKTANATRNATNSKLAISLFAVLTATLSFGGGVPDRPTSWVSDYADILTGPEERILNARLQSLEQRASNLKSS